MARKKKVLEPKEKLLPIRIEGANEVPMCYANHVFVTHTLDEFYLTFSQLHPPYFLTEPTKEEVEQLTHVPAKVVTRVAISPNKMKELVDALSENYKKFLEIQETRK